jgi:hypothetical protein
MNHTKESVGGAALNNSYTKFVAKLPFKCKASVGFCNHQQRN